MKISVIIPVINESDVLHLAIERAWNAGADELVIADGGSQDGTRDIAKNANCKLVDSQPGRGLQLNAGAKVATGDVLLFLHADNWLEAGACQQIKIALADLPNRYGGFRQRITNERRIFRWLEYGNFLRAKWQRLIYGDQAMFVSRALFDEAGGFPAITIMEDFAFSRLLGKNGAPIILEGPTFVSDRRWQKSGVFRQTLKNWFLSLAFRLGATPDWIAQQYRRHDK